MSGGEFVVVFFLGFVVGGVVGCKVSEHMMRRIIYWKDKRIEGLKEHIAFLSERR